MGAKTKAVITEPDTAPKWLVILLYHPQGYPPVVSTIEFDDEGAALSASKRLCEEWSFTDCLVVPKGTVIR